jgi:multidrug transporter EmrE-like cation transporter
MKYGIALVLALTLNAAANLLMKFGVIRLKYDLGHAVPPAMAMATNWRLILGLLLFASNIVFYTFALAGIKISTAYPIMVSGGFVIISVIAWRYLDERLTRVQWGGVLLILLGVWMVARDAASFAPQATNAATATAAQAESSLE